MKTSFQIEINSAYERIFFPEERIKTKYKILEILLEACRLILYGQKAETVDSSCKLILYKDKMARLFLVNTRKIYSIAFPFNIYYDEDKTVINYRNLLDLDSYNISNILSILKSEIIKSDKCLDFIDPIIDIESITKTNYWVIFRDLMLLEDGYIRYDHDISGYNEAMKKEKQDKHPLHHLDIFYSAQVSFKIGLDDSYLATDLIETIDSTTACKFLISKDDFYRKALQKK